jgi:glutathione S-transferase
MAGIELFQFDASHYNEKARWALDYKRVPHERHTLLPGPHRLTAMRLSGQPQVPFLRTGKEAVAGSSQIIDYLEREYPAPALYPAEPHERARALEIQEWFDREIGPEVRRAKFFDILPDVGYVVTTFARRKPWLTRNAYRLIAPAIRGVMRRELHITDETARTAQERVRAGLDFVVKEAGSHGYLVGNAFSVADLTAAALLAPTVSLPGTTMAVPEPRAAVENTWMKRWEGHPGTAWVARMYAQHRGASSATG